MNRTLVYIVLVLAVGALAAAFLMSRPHYVGAPSGSAGRDSMRVYEQRINQLQTRLDSTRAALVRRGTLDRLTVRLRTKQMEEELAQLRAAFGAWRNSHDQYGMGQSYRECVLLYGSARSSCQALAYDTLPPPPDTPPRK